jgi:hypothetical protein
MKVVGVVLAVVVAIALVVAGVWFDVGYLLIGGIEEIVRGVQATPVSGHDIGFGILRVVLTGVGFAVSIWLALLALLAGGIVGRD